MRFKAGDALVGSLSQVVAEIGEGKGPTLQPARPSEMAQAEAVAARMRAAGFEATASQEQGLGSGLRTWVSVRAGFFLAAEAWFCAAQPPRVVTYPGAPPRLVAELEKAVR